MGLRNQPEYSASPAFEPMDDETTTSTMTKDETMNTTQANATHTDAQQAQASTTAALTIAKAAASSVAVAQPAAKFAVAFADKNNVFDTATVEGLALAVPRCKGEQGSFFLGDKDLGGEINFELVSFNNRWAVGTGEQDKEAASFFRTSYDSKTISGTGESLQDYVESLKAQGFNKTKVAPYLDVFGFITWSEKLGEIPVDERQLTLLQCSQTSLGAFIAFSTTRGLLESKGLAKPIDVIGVRAMKRVSGTNKFTNFEFFVPKAK